MNPAGTFDIILEPRNQGRMGRPDWRIQDRISLGVYGYIEAKGPSNEPFDTTPYLCRKEVKNMLSENLKTLRRQKGFTQEELAARLNVVRQTVSKWEKGVSRG